eukprot:m.221824 g.221824  ORF g.221824 m.221824 type:complete len:166 (+) comp33355_c0_seq37:461-958(+)
MLTDLILFANAQCSKMVAGAAFVAVVVYRDEWTLSLVGGAICNAAVGKGLKRLLQVSRPETSNRGSHGMPSSHANSLCFYATSLRTRAYLSHTPAFSLAVQVVFVLCCVSIMHCNPQASVFYGYTATICYARVVLTKDHTHAQVVVGACLGAACALALEMNRPLY